MRDDERRKRRDDDPDEPEDLFDFEFEPEQVNENTEDIESELKRLFGSEASDEELGSPIRFEQGRELEVHITGLYERYEDGQPQALLVQLRDNFGRHVPIVIGPFEAHAIAMALSGEIPQRPMTHDLLRNILMRLDITVDRVVIDDLWHGTFYAKIFLRRGEEEIEIDARPSDAIALALRFRAPIYMAESVLEAEGRYEDLS